MINQCIAWSLPPLVAWMIAMHATAADRTLFDFDDSAAARRWTTVNDGVMGGRSDGRYQITDENTLRFYGNLSLANNGGFASVRSRPARLDLRSGDTLVARLRGDGRTYQFNLYVPTNRTAFSYRASFDTAKDEWIDVRIPLADFRAVSFGQPVPNRPLDPRRVHALGFLLGDKRPGPFQLEVDSIVIESDGSRTEPRVNPAAPTL